MKKEKEPEKSERSSPQSLAPVPKAREAPFQFTVSDFQVKATGTFIPPPGDNGDKERPLATE